MATSDLGSRMKKYEYVTRHYLTTRMPVIIRIDGRAFHTFTRGFEKPFDECLIKTMQATMKYLCENIQGCAVGYTQSDEISLLLVDYKSLNSAAWFDNNIQKCASVAASMATMAFNQSFLYHVTIYAMDHMRKREEECSDAIDGYYNALQIAVQKGAMFDARVFNLPKEEVCNYFYWRQIDAVRNSIQMVGQSQFSHRELQNLNCDQIQDKLFCEKGINWNNYPVHQRRGSCCVKTPVEQKPGRYKWTIDLEIPSFSGDGRSYIDKRVFFDEDGG